MDLKIHNVGNTNIVELISNKVEINELDDAVDLLGGAYYLEATKVVVKKEQIAPAFFSLKTKL